MMNGTTHEVTLPLSAKDTVRVELADARTYWLRPPTARLQAMAKRETLIALPRLVTQLDITTALLGAIAARHADLAERQAVTTELEAYNELAPLADPATLEGDAKAAVEATLADRAPVEKRMQELRAWAWEHSDEYRTALAHRNYLVDVTNEIALRVYVAHFTGLAVEPSVMSGLLSEASLAAIDAEDRTALLARITALATPSEAQKKG
jgi:hypothetical protein